MKRFMLYGWILVSLCVGILVVGCSKYYQVTDPESGNVYYTQKIDNMASGAVKVTDDRTGSIVTLQNSEVMKIDSDAYKAGLADPVTPPQTDEEKK